MKRELPENLARAKPALRAVFSAISTTPAMLTTFKGCYLSWDPRRRAFKARDGSLEEKTRRAGREAPLEIGYKVRK